MIAYQKLDEYHIEKICLTLILHYFATNKKIAITHLWHAMTPQTMYHLNAKDKEAEQLFQENTLTATVLELQSIYSTVRISK